MKGLLRVKSLAGPSAHSWCLIGLPSPLRASKPEAGAEVVVCEKVSACSQAGVKGFRVVQPTAGQCYSSC